MVDESTVELPTGAIRLLSGGSGPPLVLLHSDVEGARWGEFHDQLAGTFRVFAPDMPGWGGSARLEWARHPRDLAAVMLALGRTLAQRPYVLAGLGFGGWVAAEMASFAPDDLRRLVLVGAAGLKPDTSHVLDQVMMDYRDYVGAGFADPATFTRIYGEAISAEQRARWEISREVVARISWKPYMYSYELPETLRAMSAPATIIWGTKDAVVPVRCAALYAEAIPGADIELVAGGGHLLDLEEPVRLAALIAAACKEQ
ncbi:MAG: alpha/beta fold hydrolase [Dehalococcoidia bacterium]